MRRLQRSCQSRVAFRKQRPGSKLPPEHAQPYAAETEQRRHVQPAENRTAWLERRSDQPEHIYYPHQQHQRRDGCQHARTPLQRAEEQQPEGHRKTEHRQADSDRHPTAFSATQVPWDLVAEIAGPDQQVLEIRHVRPQHQKGQQQTTEVVPDARRHHLAQDSRWSRPNQHGHDERSECQRCKQVAHCDHRWIHGRVPVSVERHEPIDRGKADG